MSEFDSKQPEDKKTPFYKTPIGIIVIVVAVIFICCFVGSIITIFGLTLAGDQVGDVFEGVLATADAQSTLEAGQ